MTDFATLRNLKSDLPLFCLTACLFGFAVALALGHSNLTNDSHVGRLLQQPLIRGQFGLMTAGIVYSILMLGFGPRRISALLEEINSLAGSARGEAAKLAVAEVENQALPLSYVSWVLPVSGFIGTVIGVSAAIAPLGRLVDETGIDQDAIGAVLSGLHVAFDTTFVGLVGVVPSTAFLVLLDVSASRRVARIWALVD